MSTRATTAALLIAALTVLVGIGLWKTSGGAGPPYVAVAREPQGIMGTSCRLVAVVRRQDTATANKALSAAQAELSRVEALMSSWIELSEVSRVNAAPAGEPLCLSPETIEVLRAARQAADDTRSAFDVTCRPLIEVWRAAGRSGQLPEAQAIAAARADSNWSHFEIHDDQILKTAATARLDLGGIAKGYAIDRAVDAMRACGVAGGLVDVGGDVRCFGRPATDGPWKAQIRDPFGNGTLTEFTLGEAAVCTSGDYARFIEIDGRRYSHIIDPLSGRPADSVAAVTVVAANAITADIWATAIAVRGQGGLTWLPEGLDVLLIDNSSGEVIRRGTGRFK